MRKKYQIKKSNSVPSNHLLLRTFVPCYVYFMTCANLLQIVRSAFVSNPVVCSFVVLHFACVVLLVNELFAKM